jgi:outer membrane biosynthesis protein TonB
MKIKKTVLAAIFTALGFKTAGTWTVGKLQQNLPKIPDQVDEETKLEDANLQKALDKLLQVLKSEADVEVIDDTATDEAEEAAPAPAPKKKAAPKAAPAEAEEEAAEEAPAAAPKKKAAPKAASTTTPGGAGVVKKKATPTKKAAPAAPAADGRAGVRDSRSRPYLAGIVIKEAGAAAGVTAEMVTRLDEAYGKPNPTESKFCLRNAWHAIRGFAKGKPEELDMGAVGEVETEE